MKVIAAYLNSLSSEQQHDFARRCGTSVGYLRKAVSVGSKLGDGLCIALERESNQKLICEDIRPDIDWSYLRNKAKPATTSVPKASA